MGAECSKCGSDDTQVFQRSGPPPVISNIIWEADTKSMMFCKSHDTMENLGVANTDRYDTIMVTLNFCELRGKCMNHHPEEVRKLILEWIKQIECYVPADVISQEVCKLDNMLCGILKERGYNK